MKRLIISLSIIAVILAAGFFAIKTVSGQNDRLYGMVESVLREYSSGGDAAGEIGYLKKFFEEEYVRKLSALVDDDKLAGISESIDRLLPMLEADCDEFRAECESIKSGARLIYLNELPAPFRIF